MNSIKTFLIAFLAGLVAGLLVLARSQRRGEILFPAAQRAGGVGGAVETDAANTAAMVSGEGPRSAAIVAGARAEVERARQVVDRLRSAAPSFAQRRQAGRQATPETSPDQPV